tara:strand:- start:4894 stop:5127 length:234 start_codon:yes stop_codon:yes gene_type:complete
MAKNKLPETEPDLIQVSSTGMITYWPDGEASRVDVFTESLQDAFERVERVYGITQWEIGYIFDFKNKERWEVYTPAR